jgi:hypothetical protein
MLDSFPIQKQGDTLSQLLSIFAIEYAIKNVQQNQVGLKFNRTQSFLVNANYSNLLGNNIDATNKTQKF